MSDDRTAVREAMASNGGNPAPSCSDGMISRSAARDQRPQHREVELSDHHYPVGIVLARVCGRVSSSVRREAPPPAITNL